MADNRKIKDKSGVDEQPPLDVDRAEDFFTIYANNVSFEQSVWDLKLIFGLLDQTGGTARVEQVMAATIPWLQAKLLSILLDMNLAAHEAENGKIAIPQRMIPVLPPTHEANKKNPKTRAIAEAVEVVFNRRLAEL
jgi:hypothetical protein